MDDLTDRAVVRRLPGGDQRAFDEFFADYLVIDAFLAAELR